MAETIKHYRKHSEDEVKWGVEVLKRYQGKAPYPPRLIKEGILEEYKKKFKADIDPKALHSWMSKTVAKQLDPTYKPYSRVGAKYKAGGDRNIIGILKKSNYLIYIPTSASLFGFDSVDEVKQAIIDNKIVGEIHLFKKEPINIEVNVKIGE